ncbi:MAG TPA: hypothetical protein VNH44_01115 [Micropepsaceae bacterium]|nr:hypothetical protein [Micropepsaceae bacterium]
MIRTKSHLAAAALASTLGFPAVASAAIATQSDFDQFEVCYGSLEGAQTVLPKLQPEFDPATYEQVTKATRDFLDAFLDMESRLSKAVIHPDKASLSIAHIRGYRPWTLPENQSLDYWSRNGPMPVSCFDLFKRLNETLPLPLP